MPNPWLLRLRGAQERKVADVSIAGLQIRLDACAVMVAVGCNTHDSIPMNGSDLPRRYLQTNPTNRIPKSLREI